MTDLENFQKLFKKQKQPQATWGLSDPSEIEKAASVFVFGCPDGNGAFLQVIFDKYGNTLEALVLEPSGEICMCKYCDPRPKKEKKKDKKKGKNK